MNEYGFELLASRIVKYAVEDYKNAYRYLVKSPGNKPAKDRLLECEEFFLSDWFDTLMDVDGSAFLRKLKKLCKDKYGEIKEKKDKSDKTEKIYFKKCA